VFLFGSTTTADNIASLYVFNSGYLTIEENASSRAGLISDLFIHCNSWHKSTALGTHHPALQKRQMI